MLFNTLSLFVLALAGTASSVTASPEAGSNPALHMLYKRQTTSSSSTSTTGLTLTGPGPGEVFRAGGTCKVTWSPDTTGASTWKTFTIDLMTGANQNMTKLATLAQNVDGTSTTQNSFSWTCPEVKPYSAIYFYQATTDGTTDPQWTTRWTIASADGQSTAPPDATQPGGGQAIPWGNGKLINAAPAVVNGAGGSAAASGAATSGSASSIVSSASSVEATSSASVNVPSGVAVDAASSASSASSAAQSTASSKSSGAVAYQASSATAGVLAVVAAAAAAFVL